MDVMKVPQRTRLIIKVQTGVSTSGSAVYRQRSFNNIRPDASDAAMYEIGVALAGLQMHPLEWIGRIDDVQLEEQADE